MIMFLCRLQTEEMLLKNHLEQLAFLTKKANMVHEKDVRAKLGDNVSLKLKLSLMCVRLHGFTKYHFFAMVLLPTCRETNASNMHYRLKA